jgi:SIR2-like domain
LDTFHRKVLWSLLTMRPVIFVGFSVDDPAFRLMLDFVREDFDLAPGAPAHIAVLPSDPGDKDHQQSDADQLRPFGILPVFYDTTRDASGATHHDLLPTFFDEIAASIGSLPGPPTLGTLNRRMLAR